MKTKIGISIMLALLLLLAFGGTASARSGFGDVCSYCHNSIINNDYTLTDDGKNFDTIHQFDGENVPSNVDNCLNCHIDLTDYLLNSKGQNYSASHRYNSTTLASANLDAPGCANCHVDVESGDYTMITDAATYMGSETCEDCHKAKYDTWGGTLHRVMLTPRVDAEAMDLPLPADITWDNISFVRITKFELDYVNATGYFLAVNDTYNTETEEWGNGSHAGGAYCGAECHTTGWNGSAVNTELPGMPGTFAEPGIGCERCHGAAGNGHQVTVDYSSDLCIDCHEGSHHGTGWEDGGHAPPAARNGASCVQCHSPFDGYTNNGAASKDNSTNVPCGVCHNIHDMTDDKYANTFLGGTFNNETWSEVSNAKLAFFNASASVAAGKAIFDDLISNVLLYAGIDSSRKSAFYGTDPINLTGRPASDVLCAKCHYRHGLGHMAVNASHGTAHGDGAACVDCHMSGASATVGKDMMKSHGGTDPLDSCGGATQCHTTSTQNLSESKYSVVPVIAEWEASAHNVKEVGVGGSSNHWYYERNRTTDEILINITTGEKVKKQELPLCNKCHDPTNWNPDDDSDTEKVPTNTDFKGVACITCHNLHDMGDWLVKTKEKYGESKSYGLYTVDLFKGSHDRDGYTMVESTTELCGSCHDSNSGRANRDEPGWENDADTKPNYVHGYPAKDLFVGSWKQEGMLKFECIDCHMTSVVENSTSVLPDSEKIKGHSFKVNATLLQENSECLVCHATGSELGNISTTIENIQADTHEKWNTTNQTVEDALAAVNAYEGEKSLSRDKIAQAYWNKEFVSREESWGVHNPSKIDELLDDAVRLANEANASLGVTSDVVSSVPLKAGLNLVALKGTPTATSAASVMSSVKDNISTVWGYSAGMWELYDPTMDAAANTLENIVPGKGYWIYAKEDCEWTA